jgi:hypothetical protein
MQTLAHQRSKHAPIIPSVLGVPHKADKEPPRLPLLTWDEEQAAKDEAADNAATPLRSPDAVARHRQKKTRFANDPATTFARQQPNAAPDANAPT